MSATEQKPDPSLAATDSVLSELPDQAAIDLLLSAARTAPAPIAKAVTRAQETASELPQVLQEVTIRAAVESPNKLRQPKPPQVVLTGNSEIDKNIGGGLPLGSLTLIEGESDAGKSVFIQELVWGTLNTGMRIVFYTTENSTQSLLRQMSSLSFDALDFFLLGKLNIYPVPNTFSEEQSHSNFDLLLSHISRMEQFQVFIVDSLTAFITHASESETLRFFSRAKDICDAQKTIIVSMHSYAIEEQLLTRLRSICDAHFRMRVEEVGNQLVKVLEVAKVRGAGKSTGNIVSFEVEPDYGMKIIPIMSAKV